LAAPTGNQFWLQRSTHGRKPIFACADDLWNAACEYFQWVEDNPLKEGKIFSYQGDIVEGEVSKMRAMTIQAMCFFLDISDDTWADYCKRDDFIGITSEIKKVIFAQKFEGAAADLLNANIISRELGLVDKKQLSGDSENPIIVKTARDLTDDDLANIAAGSGARAAE
jgi:hypothetical protein